MITTVQAGLADIHRVRTPILDRIERLGHGAVRVTRTYEDGAQYLIFSDPNDPATRGVGPAWSRLATITPEGVARLQQVIRESVLSYDPHPPVAGPSGGGTVITWVVHIGGRERVVETPGGSYATLPPFVRQLDEAVSRNVVRGQ